MDPVLLKMRTKKTEQPVNILTMTNSYTLNQKLTVNPAGKPPLLASLLRFREKSPQLKSNKKTFRKLEAANQLVVLWICAEQQALKHNLLKVGLLHIYSARSVKRHKEAKETDCIVIY